MNYKMGDKVTIKSKEEIAKLQKLTPINIDFEIYELENKSFIITHKGFSSKFREKFYYKLNGTYNNPSFYSWMFKQKQIWI